MAIGNREVTDLPLLSAVNGSDLYAVKSDQDYRVKVGGPNGLVYFDTTGRLASEFLQPNLATFNPALKLNVADYSWNTIPNKPTYFPTNWANVTNTPTTLAGYGITDAVPSSIQVIAGNGLIGGGSLAVNRTITMGTPSTLSGSTTNAVTSTSHTHALSTNLSAWDGITPATKVDSYSPMFAGGYWYVKPHSAGHTGTWNGQVLAYVTETSYSPNPTFYISYRDSASAPVALDIRTSGRFVVPAGEVWHPGNDGAGSGLDADLLDGQQGSYYAAATHNHDAAYLAIGGTAAAATKLATARTINGTNFDGSANITTTSWGTARTLTLGSSAKSVNGSANVSWTLAEMGAVANGGSVAAITKLTQAAYDALGTKDANTLYVIVG